MAAITIVIRKCPGLNLCLYFSREHPIERGHAENPSIDLRYSAWALRVGKSSTLDCQSMTTIDYVSNIRALTDYDLRSAMSPIMHLNFES